jgi:hypothetical protein
MADKDTFNNLAEAFDMNNEFDMPEEAKQFDSNKKDLMINARGIEDKEYLQEEIKLLIEQGKRVLDKIDKDLKLGSQPRMFEVYGSVFNSVMTGIKELRELNKNVADIELKSNPVPTQGKIELTASEFSKLIKMQTKEIANNNMKDNAIEAKVES